MQNVRVVAKNYRCFQDSAPLDLTIGPGFCALLGPNNSGKSSALKLFHELRAPLSALRDPSNLQTLAAGKVMGSQAVAVEDQSEIFSNRNERPLTLELSITSPTKNQLAMVRLTSDRTSATNWGGNCS